MTESDVLERWGWKPFFADQLTHADVALEPARVTRQDLNRYQLITARGTRFATLRGRARLDAGTRADLPVVGDWVLCSAADGQEAGALVIERSLARFSKFSRKEAGDRNEEQVVAANIDTVFIVTGLDDNFSPARIERYLLLASGSGARAVIVLSKADLCLDTSRCIDAIQPIVVDVPVHVVSALDHDSINVLRQYVHSGATVALLGSSGVGKSTIINRLLGHEYFLTQEVRGADSKGRHTTTFRELCEVPGGGILMDTPGMREVQFWADDDGLGEGFDLIENLARHCRFSDCGHDSEPDCAVKAAIARGDLPASRLESYRKFRKELAHLEARQQSGTLAQRRAESRKFTKMVKRRQKKRDSE